MLSHSILLTALLSTSPDFATSVTPEQECAPAPLEPERIDAQPFSSTAVDGIQMWGSAATYRLSSGDIGEAFLVIDSAGTGELQLMIHGEIIAHVAIALDASSGQPVVTTWPGSQRAASPRKDLRALHAEERQRSEPRPAQSLLMGTATDEHQQPERHLLDHPQPLGILPTWWFWNQRENWRLVGWGFGLLAAIITITIPLLNLPPLMAGLVAAGTLMTAIGLLEKYVRHQAERRRALAGAEAGEALVAPLDSSED